MSLYFSWHGHICTHSSTLWELLLSGPRAFLLGCPSSPRPRQDGAEAFLQEAMLPIPSLHMIWARARVFFIWNIC